MNFDPKTLPDDFSELLLEGCMRVAKDKQNPVRFHLFAAGLRELFGHILHFYAPDEEVRECGWFTQSKDTETVTRKQRAIYATQGGLSNSFISDLGLDIKPLHQAAIKAIEELNKATHVRPGTVITDEKQIESLIEKSLSALQGLIFSFQICRASIAEILQDQLYTSVAELLITRTFDQIDILAGKGYEVDTSFLDPTVIVKSITSKEISVAFSGIVPVTLHYGKGEDSAEIGHDLPFEMLFKAPINNPLDLKHTESYFDHSSWSE